MELEQVLHMNGGVGKTSYATNSLHPRAVISLVKPIVNASIEQLCGKLFSDCLKIADLGCSSGPNTLLVVSDIIHNIHAAFQKLNRPYPTIQVFLNDLPGNDFNTVFRSLPGFYKKFEEELKLGPCFITAMPGSFYGRLFPNNSLCIKSHDPLCIWEVVGLKLNDMVLEGLIEDEKLDTFDLPYYAPTTKEVEDVIEAEGSLTLQSLEVLKNDWDSYIKRADGRLDRKARAAVLATDIRAVGEPILATQFGEAAMDDLFRRFEEDVLDHMDRENCQYISLVISLTKKR
ncbi:3,7-dimethylxanthine N-methyltransferase 1-like [Pyrus x bretschneideri]|uniref:3,7-dimethylxanthine N-methyltransferase 1-like n=1 Tax=Pyrus x bretschneideri TaxID=225117 RepID=UPI0020309E0C|nr:3,7-dimethylxanthine N-methyltransferase 1-like [Pyrus x bretschneideri]